MGKHSNDYVPRRVVVSFPRDPKSPWFANARSTTAGFRIPQSQVVRAKKGPPLRVCEGGTIWLVSQLVTPWAVLPPGIDARLCVSKIIRRPHDVLEYQAGRYSSWLPLANAMTLLVRLSTRAGNGGVAPLLGPHRWDGMSVGPYLQSMRELASGEEFLEWARTLRDRPMNFISYRICDGTRQAYEVPRAASAERNRVLGPLKPAPPIGGAQGSSLRRGAGSPSHEGDGEMFQSLRY